MYYSKKMRVWVGGAMITAFVLIGFAKMVSAAGLTLPQGGLGTTTVPTNWVVIGKDANRVTAVATSSLGLVNSVSNSDGTLTISPTTAAVIASINLAHANIWTALQSFSNASTTLLTVSGTEWITPLGTPAGALLAVDPTGKIIATTTSSGVTSVTGTYPIISSGGNTPAISIAFGTTTANTWALLQTFTSGLISQASSTIAALHLGTPLEVASGGTASTTLGGILTGNGTGAVTSASVSSPLTFSANTLACATCLTSQFPTSTNPLMATYFVATSTTQASVFPQASTTQLTVGGAGTSTNMLGNVHIFGALQVDGNFVASVNIVAGGNATLGGTLAVTGAGTFSSTLSAGTTTLTNLIVTNTSTSTFAGGVQTTALNLTSATATSTAANGFNIASGCYAIAGTCLSSGGTSSAWPWVIATNFGTSTNSTTTPTWYKTGVYASSTSQFVNATTSQFTHLGTTWFPGSGIWTSGGSVGIGTTNPSLPLVVNGSAAVTGSLGVGQAPAASLWVHTGTNNNVRFLDHYSLSNGLNIDSVNDIQSAFGALSINATELSLNGVSGGVMYLNTSSRIGAGMASLSYNGNSAWGFAIDDSASVASSLFEAYSTNGTNIGSVQNNANVGVLFNTVSDRRLKENIASSTLGLTTLLKIPVDDFSFKTDKTHALHNGFIAQELYKIYPDAVSTNGDNGIDALGASTTPWGVDYGRITPLIVKSIQDMYGQMQNILARLDGNDKRLNDLEARVKALEAAK